VAAGNARFGGRCFSGSAERLVQLAAAPTPHPVGREHCLTYNRPLNPPLNDSPGSGSTMHIFRSSSLMIAALGVAISCGAWAQRMVQIPAAALRASITFQGSPDVVIDGKTARLAPGVRIFDTNNMLVLYGSLNGTVKAKLMLETTSGLVQSVWILTDQEIATPDPATPR
jgi:hypothetical protein